MHLHFFPHIFLHHRRIFVHYFLSYIDDKRQRELKISNNRVNSYYKQSLEWSTKIVKPQVQYASYQYTDLLKKYGIKISMTETGNPKDNAVAERVNNTIKNELLKGMSFTSMLEVSEAVKAAIRFYNEERPHLSLDGLTPREAAKKRGEFDKKWISYREKAIKAKVA